MKHSKTYSPWVSKICLVLTLLFGLAYLSLFINYQPFLSTGDHGLNLYAAKAVTQGQRPFHDFHWFYGPFMPYFYAAFLKLFGFNIQSVLLGSIFLKLLSGLFVYATCALFISPILAFICAASFWLLNFDFFYTYNHTGGITLSLFILYTVFLYYKHRKSRYLLLGHIGCLFLGLIKLNLGFCGLFCVNMAPVFCVLFLKDKLCRQTILYLIITSILIPLLLIATNGLFIIGLPFYIIRQCYQYFGTDAHAHEYQNFFQSMSYLVEYTLSRIKPHLDLLILCLSSLLALVFICLSKNKSENEESSRPTFLLTVGTLLLFIICFAHEYILSGVLFRVFWAQPFAIVFIFFTIGFASQRLGRLARTLVIILLIAFIGYRTYLKYQTIQPVKIPDQYLALNKANLHVGNTHGWIYAVTRTTRYLEERIKDGDSIFVLPYDPLYYFLLDKSSPTRQIAILQFLNIPLVQEKSIIEELESKPVQWVIISNRSISTHAGTGTLGQTYGHLIDQYIKDNYQLEKEFGDWVNEPEWTKNHGTRILKRVTPFR